MRWNIAILTGAMLIAFAHGARADVIEQNRADYQNFTQAYLCRVTSYLTLLDRSEIDRNQYLVLAPVEDPSKYVQCVFRLDENLLCEASSYFYRNRRDGPKLYRLAEDKRKLLERDGFTFRPRGNFYLEIERPKDQDYEPIARFLLTILYEVYDVRFLNRLRIQRPRTLDALSVRLACDDPHINQGPSATPISPGSTK